jgi:hypothetical protein
MTERFGNSEDGSLVTNSRLFDKCGSHSPSRCPKGCRSSRRQSSRFNDLAQKLKAPAYQAPPQCPTMRLLDGDLAYVSPVVIRFNLDGKPEADPSTDLVARSGFAKVVAPPESGLEEFLPGAAVQFRDTTRCKSHSCCESLRVLAQTQFSDAATGVSFRTKKRATPCPQKRCLKKCLIVCGAS